ncbi:GIY-YIG nuclease family protein [Candidatus Uhrbacteria bacterium]|nr:GIY-YIG nuclease family protein [Candidatus Uhrbacteria bacterium]
MAWLYILRSDSERTYIGSTDDIERRLSEHLRGQTKSTRGYLWKLVFKQEFQSHNEAAMFERRLKRWKSKVVIDKIIRDGKVTAR